MPFQLESSYKPRGDQGQAIAKLLKSVEAGNRHQTLLGVTGSGKTFSIANVVQELDRPILVISHNKTLAAQLYSEFKQFFPRNAVEYFVSYFDYYQPEAYIPRSDTYIEKDSSINEEIERLRLAATSALLSRRDTIVVASVSCIYGITSPEDYLNMLLTVKRSQHSFPADVLAAFYREQHVQVIFRRCNAVNARDACDHDGVTARKQCAGRGEPQTLDLFVNRRIFFDVGVGAGDIGFRLVVIEIADEIFNGVARKELLEIGVELRGQRFIMGDDERGPIDFADYVCDRKSFARTGHARS